MTAKNDSLVYISSHKHHDFEPSAHTTGGNIWASPGGSTDIVLSPKQWTEWIALIQQQIDFATSNDVEAVKA